MSVLQTITTTLAKDLSRCRRLARVAIETAGGDQPRLTTLADFLELAEGELEAVDAAKVGAFAPTLIAVDEPSVPPPARNGQADHQAHADGKRKQRPSVGAGSRTLPIVTIDNRAGKIRFRKAAKDKLFQSRPKWCKFDLAPDGAVRVAFLESPNAEAVKIKYANEGATVRSTLLASRLWSASALLENRNASHVQAFLCEACEGGVTFNVRRPIG